ncbi:MAG TPA: PBP1A family penicillin-binding protein [Longimicrobiales bacterium]|nr:PBP1A family penicillin-binding protein [Longimicrobiales bacterium]
MRKSLIFAAPALLAAAVLTLPPRALAQVAGGGARACPTIDALRNYRAPEATRVFALDGSVIADLSPQRRVVVELSEIPPTVTNGFVAVEDRRFWTHDGVDIRGVGRAIWRDITSLSLAEGFSTITMQLARNVFPEELPQSDRLRRKLCEIRLAGDIEDVYSKRDILKMYINQIYFGDGKYGIEEASRNYFGKPARQLTLPEAALLVGAVKNPEGYNPRRNPQAAVARRNVVLDVMARERVITTADAARARATPLRLAPPAEAAGPAPYVVAAVRRELRERFGDDADVKGLRVFTGIDPAVQRAARDALVAQLRRIEAGEYGRWPHARADSAGRLAAPQSNGSQYLQGMVLVLDAGTGAVRALVGGRDFAHSSFDRALLGRRQPGSAFKPVVYAAALHAGLSPATQIDATPVTVALSSSAWRPEDLVPDSVTSLSVRDALVLSSNNATVRIGEWAGVERVIGMARTLGISTAIPSYPSIFLGSAEVSPAELTAAYAVLGNGGTRVTPTIILRVEDARGRVLYRAPAATPALDAGVAFITTSLMQDAIDRGTGTAVRRAGFFLPAAGKTGTTNDAKDVWFVGMTPDLVAGVWLGFDQPRQILPNAFGGNLAAPVWAQTMKAAYANRAAPMAWTPPETLVSLPIDAKSGRLATPNCPPADLRIEHFVPGTEPRDYCPTHPEGLLQRLLRRGR